MQNKLFMFLLFVCMSVGQIKSNEHEKKQNEDYSRGIESSKCKYCNMNFFMPLHSNNNTCSACMKLFDDAEKKYFEQCRHGISKNEVCASCSQYNQCKTCGSAIGNDQEFCDDHCHKRDLIFNRLRTPILCSIAFITVCYCIKKYALKN